MLRYFLHYHYAPPHENELPKPFIVGKDDGIPNRAHRIKALGNTIDPEFAEILGARIAEIEQINPDPAASGMKKEK